VNQQGNCVVYVHFGRSIVSFDVLWLGQRGIRLFSGFPPFWLQYYVAIKVIY
jgi:hypothetical protein